MLRQQNFLHHILILP